MNDTGKAVGVRRRRATSAPTTPDAVEIAMESVAGGDAGAEARAVLRGQSALFAEQIGLARNERFRNRIKAVRDMALSFTVLALLGGAGTVLWNAHQATGLVIEAFRTPPEMAAEGLDGSVIAARLLDRLSAMQAGTDSSRAPASFGSNWDDSLSVEVPQTGMSAGEVWRMLRQTLGDETRLSGDLTRSADGMLTLTTRVGPNPGVVVTGGPGDLDRLMDKAAEGVYRQAQPYRYAVWLSRTDGGGDAAILSELGRSGDRTERLWALVGQSVNAYETDPMLTVALAREALALDPTFHKARWNLSDGYVLLGWSEADLAEARTIARVMRRRDPRVTRASQDQVLYANRGAVGRYLGDYDTMLENARIQAGLPDYSGNALGARYEIVMAHIGLHDVAAARAALAAADRGAPQPVPSRLAGAALALESGDGARTIALIREAMGETEDGDLRDWLRVGSDGRRGTLARLLVGAGDLTAAEATLAGTRADCYPCAVERARLAAARGDRAGAVRLFRQATEMGPSLPWAWLEWGRARLAWGNPEGARLAFEVAHRKGPRWADPLKYEGDALLMGDDARGAERLYRKALERAPRWGALHLAWGRALERQGRRNQARDKYNDAARMDLSAADRAEVAQRLAAVSRGL